MPRTPEELLETIVGADGDTPVGASLARLVAELAARTADEGTGGADLDEAMLAAYLDAELDETERGAMDETLARSPEAVHDLLAASSLIDAIATDRKKVPADLLTSCEKISHRARPERRVRWQWIGAGIGLAMAALAAVVLVRYQLPPNDLKATQTARPEVPEQRQVPTMLPAGREEVSPRHSPQQLEPANSQEVAPTPRSDKH